MSITTTELMEGVKLHKIDTNKLKTQEDINIKLEELYGADFNCGIDKLCNDSVFKFYMESLNDEFLYEKENVLEQSTQMLFDIVFSPLTENGMFNEEYFNSEKENLRQIIRSRKDNKGAYAYSIHPLCAINDRYEAYKKLANAVFTIEGNSEHLDRLMQIFQKCGNDIIKIDTQKKALYHASAVMASNLVTALFATSIDLLNRCGVDKKMAKNILLPLLQGNVANLTTFDIKDALTGPVERNDVVTIKKHLRLLEIAQSKNSLKDYSEMKEVFDSEKYSINI